MLSVLLLQVLLGAPPSRPAASSFLIFGEGQRWVVLSDKGELVAKLEIPPGVPRDVREAEISDDGELVAFAAFEPAVENVSLFLWNRLTGEVRRIGGTRGFHAAPSFSPDRQRLVFAHHPNKGGPPGMHMEGSFAQLYEQDLTTDKVRALTEAPGCHMKSTVRGDRVIYAHADCHGGRRLEILTNGVTRPLSVLSDLHGEPRLSRDGKRLVATRVAGDILQIVEVALAGKKPARVAFSGMRVGNDFRPAFLADGRLIFQLAGAVNVIERNGILKVVTQY